MSPKGNGKASNPGITSYDRRLADLKAAIAVQDKHIGQSGEYGRTVFNDLMIRQLFDDVQKLNYNIETIQSGLSELLTHENNRVLTVSDVAAHLQCSESHVRKLLLAGKIKALPKDFNGPWRVLMVDFKKYLNHSPLYHRD